MRPEQAEAEHVAQERMDAAANALAVEEAHTGALADLVREGSRRDCRHDVAAARSGLREARVDVDHALSAFAAAMTLSETRSFRTLEELDE